MTWQPLVEVSEDHFFRGAVFRFPAEEPFEPIVDFMMIEDLNSPSRYRVICSTGYHAGRTERVLPAEAKHPKGGIAVDWLKTNWSNWIYENCPVEKVLYLQEYPSNYGL